MIVKVSSLCQGWDSIANDWLWFILNSYVTNELSREKEAHLNHFFRGNFFEIWYYSLCRKIAWQNFWIVLWHFLFRWWSLCWVLTEWHAHCYSQVRAPWHRPWAYQSPGRELRGNRQFNSLYPWRSADRLRNKEQAHKLVSYLQQRSSACPACSRGHCLSRARFPDSVSLLLRQWGTGVRSWTHATKRESYFLRKRLRQIHHEARTLPRPQVWMR